MKKLLLLCPLLLLMLNTAFALQFFDGSYAEALQKSKKENKLVLLYFTATWCGPCQYMQKYVFPDPTLTAYASQHYIALKLDIDTKEGQLMYEKSHQPRGPRGVPAYIIMNANEEVLKKEVGGMKIKQFIAFLTTDKSELAMYKVLSDSVAASQVEQSNHQRTNMGKLIYDSNFSNWKPGICVGTNLMGFKGTDHNHDLTVGYDVGLFIYRGFKLKNDRPKFWDAARYDFQTGISLKGKGGTLQIDGIRNEVNLHYLTWNLSNNYAIKGFHGLQVSATPYASLALWGNRTTAQENRKLDFGNDLSQKDYGIELGMSKNYGSFKAYLGYDLGLNDIRIGENKAYNRGFFFSFAMVVGK
jgi:thiol-disulfide isomerase/thioredoxin